MSIQGTNDTRDSTILTSIDQIKFARMLALKGALSLECRGLRRRGRSAYSIIKEEFNLRGDKYSVLQQFKELIDGITRDHRDN